MLQTETHDTSSGPRLRDGVPSGAVSSGMSEMGGLPAIDAATPERDSGQVARGPRRMTMTPRGPSSPIGSGKTVKMTSRQNDETRLIIHPAMVDRWVNPNFWDYVLAWWEGYDTDVLRRAALKRRELAISEAAKKVAAKPADATNEDTTLDMAPRVLLPPAHLAMARAMETADLGRDSSPVWTAERVMGAELLWGADATGPNNPEWMVDAVRQFGLGPSRSALELTAGLGGNARAIATTFDTWVTGLEPSPVLAALAMQRSKELGKAKRAPVSAYDPENFNQAGAFDLVFGDRLVHRIQDKGFFLDNVVECVKSKGGLLLFDYVIQDTPESWEAWNRWRDIELTDVSPWSVARFNEELVQRNIDVRVAENLTEVHRQEILARIKQLSDALKTAPVDGSVLGGIARELALWWARLKVLGKGLQFYRFVGFKLA